MVGYTDLMNSGRLPIVFCSDMNVSEKHSFVLDSRTSAALHMRHTGTLVMQFNTWYLPKRGIHLDYHIGCDTVQVGCSTGQYRSLLEYRYASIFWVHMVITTHSCNTLPSTMKGEN